MVSNYRLYPFFYFTGLLLHHRCLRIVASMEIVTFLIIKEVVLVSLLPGRHLRPASFPFHSCLNMSNTAPVSNCTLKTCSFSQAYLDYDPSLAGNAFYVGIFGALLLVQCYQGCYYRTWTYTLGMLLDLSGEVIGYIARIQMSFNLFLVNPFLMYVINSLKLPPEMYG